MELRSGERSSYNFYRVLRAIWHANGVSRADLATTHQLDKTTISQIVSELVTQGLVRVQDIDTSSSRPGRKSELLTVNDEWGVVAGIEVRSDAVNVCAVDMHGAIIATHHHRQSVERTNLRDACLRGLESLQSDDRVFGRPLIGVGVGVTGVVNRAKKRIIHSIPLNIQDPYDFGHQVARSLSVPIMIDNDANCCAWGELVRNKEGSARNFLFVLLEFRSPAERHRYGGDIGLGLGLVIDGSVYYGTSGSAGEFRSILWHPGYTNQFAIPDAEARDILNQPGVFPRLVEELAQHIGFLTNTLNLGAVYFGGDVGSIESYMRGAFENAIERNWPYEGPTGCRVEVTRLDRDLVAVGAAAMVLEHVFSEPSLSVGLRAQNSLWKSIFTARRSERETVSGSSVRTNQEVL